MSKMKDIEEIKNASVNDNLLPYSKNSFELNCCSVPIDENNDEKKIIEIPGSYKKKVILKSFYHVVNNFSIKVLKFF